MAKLDFRLSTKHIQIDKANSMMVGAAAVTTAIVIFSIIAANSLYKQMNYQNKVISLRSKANKQLEANIKSVNTLTNSYQTFENSSESVIGTAAKNSKVVLDALPSKYDFPALATSVDGIVTGSGSKTSSITGTDAEASAEQDSINPKPVEIPFQVSANSSYANIQKLITDLQRSIRPMKITSINFSGNESNMQANITVITYYQPEKKLDVQATVVPGPGAKSKTSTSTNGAKK